MSHSISRCFVMIVVALMVILTGPVEPVRADAKDDQIAALTARIAVLEKKIAELERKAAGSSAQTAEAKIDLTAIRTKARQRMQQDAIKYKPEQLREIEALYQPSNDRSQRGSEHIKASLEKLINNFPDSNRAGCAVLYLAQWADGDEREKLFLTAIDKHGETFYGDGCQVGPYARFQLGQFYLSQKQPEKAKAQFDAIRTETPDAIDHSGKSLVAQIDQ